MKKIMFLMVMLLIILSSFATAQRNRSAMIRWYDTYLKPDLHLGTFGGLDSLTVGGGVLIDGVLEVGGVRVIDFYEVTVSLTEAQIEDLDNTPVQLIGATGAGTVIEIIGAFASYTFISAGYNSSLNLIIRYDGLSDYSSLFNFINGSADKMVHYYPNSTGVMGENLKVEMYLSGDSGTTGDGTVKIYLTYRIITI